MKKRMLILLLAATLVVAGCSSRISEEDPTPEPASSAGEPASTEESSEVSAPEPPKTHEIDDKEQIAEATAIVTNLFDRGKQCDKIVTGQLPLFADLPPQTLEDEEYFLVESADFATLGAIESYWNNTFVPEGKASEKLKALQESRLYGSINGQLYLREHGDLAPLTMGEWDISTLRVLSFSETSLLVAMETKLVGQPYGEQQLSIVKPGENWLLGESYFLD